MGEIAMVISAIVGTVATVASVSQANKAAKLQKQQSELQNRRSQRQAIREAQIRRAQTMAGAVAGGAQYGSGISGGLASLSSQTGETLGYSSQMSGLNNRISMADQKSKMFGSVGDFGFKAFDALGGWGYTKDKLGIQ